MKKKGKEKEEKEEEKKEKEEKEKAREEAGKKRGGGKGPKHIPQMPTPRPGMSHIEHEGKPWAGHFSRKRRFMFSKRSFSERKHPDRSRYRK